MRVDAGGLAAAADWDALRLARDLRRRRPRRARARAGADLGLNEWALTGGWAVEEESAVLGPAAGSIAYRFEARDLNLVLGAERTARFTVLLDGEPPGEDAGSTWTAPARACSPSRGCTSWSARAGRPRADVRDRFRARRARLRLHVRLTAGEVLQVRCGLARKLTVSSSRARSMRLQVSSPDGRNGLATAWPSSSETAAHSSPPASATITSPRGARLESSCASSARAWASAGYGVAEVDAGVDRGELHRPGQLLEGVFEASHVPHGGPKAGPAHQA